MDSAKLYGQVAIIFDHAYAHSAFFRESSGLGIIFSGPSLKADDVLARDIAYHQIQLNKDVILVTEDAGLKRRCRQGSASSPSSLRKTKKQMKKISAPIVKNNRKLQTIGSFEFAEFMMRSFVDSKSDETSLNSLTQNEQMNYRLLESVMQRETSLRSQCQYLMRMEARSRERKLSEIYKRDINSVKIKIQEAVSSCRRQLNEMSEFQDLVLQSDEKSYEDNTNAREICEQASVEGTLQTAILERELADDSTFLFRSCRIASKLASLSRTVGRAEETWERIVLAENMRRNLSLNITFPNAYVNPGHDMEGGSGDSWTAAGLFVEGDFSAGADVHEGDDASVKYSLDVRSDTISGGCGEDAVSDGRDSAGDVGYREQDLLESSALIANDCGNRSGWNICSDSVRSGDVDGDNSGSGPSKGTAVDYDASVYSGTVIDGSVSDDTVSDVSVSDDAVSSIWPSVIPIQEYVRYINSRQFLVAKGKHRNN